MKIRSGFVSNSSSSSFIIAIDRLESSPCHHCGLTKPNIISIIGNGYSSCSDEYEIHSGDELLREYRSEKEKLEDDLLSIEAYPDDHVLHYWQNSNYTVGDKRSQAKFELDRICSLSKKVKTAMKSKDVYSIKISIHDDFLNELIKTYEIIDSYEG